MIPVLLSWVLLTSAGVALVGYWRRRDHEILISFEGLMVWGLICLAWATHTTTSLWVWVAFGWLWYLTAARYWRDRRSRNSSDRLGA